MNDCLIVGGGVIGLSLAYELVQRGLRICVVDRSEPGQEASWAGAGILPPGNLSTATDPLEQLRGLSHQLHADWAQALRAETGIDTGYDRCGGLYLSRSAGEAAALAGLADMLRSLEIRIEHLSAELLPELEPALAPLVQSGELKAAYLLPDEAQLRNPRHLQALLRACRQRGVEIRSNVEVKELCVRSGRLNQVRTTDGVLAAEQYCIAAGAWTFQLLNTIGIRTGIMPIRGQIVMFAADARPFERILNEGSRYLVPRMDGRVLVGSTEEEVGFDRQTTEEATQDLGRLALGLVPCLRNAKIERCWAGLRPGTFDGLPYLGRIPALENAFVAAGHFRNGLHMSTGTAVVLGQLIRGESPQIDLGQFRIGRG